MKKFWITVAALTLVALLGCFAACDGSGEMLSEINDALRKGYDTLTVEVITEKDGVELNGLYNVRFNADGATVKYSYDKLNELDFGDNADEYVTKVTGEAEIADGKIVGDEKLDFGPIDYTGFNFKSAFFTDVKVSKLSFSAKVVNPQGFVGNVGFDGTDMYVETVLNGDALAKLLLGYVSAEGFSVTVNYLFA